MNNRLFSLFFILLCNCNLSFASDKADLIINYQAFTDADKVILVFDAHLPEAYYTYANNTYNLEHDFKVTELSFSKNTQNLEVPIFYPKGQIQKDFFDPSIEVYAYSPSFKILATLASSELDTNLQAQIDLLLCSSKHCIPYKESLNLSSLSTLDLSTLAKINESPDYAELNLLLNSQSAQNLQNEQVVPKLESNFNPSYLVESLEVTSLGLALILGFLAGLILNVMPCVLPVISLKISTLLVGDYANESEKMQNFRNHNIFFALGILSWFMILAFLFAFLGMQWGELFQSQIVVYFLLIFMFMLGLSMLGLYNLPIIDLKANSSNSPKSQAYFTGLMATLLATPCSGPLLGAVLGFSFMQAYYIIFIVFLATGLGMATPYLLLAALPRLAKYIPKPGNWLITLERVLAFFLLATAIYLLSILPSDKYIKILIMLLTLSILTWLYSAYALRSRTRLKKNILSTLCLVLGIMMIFWASQSKVDEELWQSYKPSEFTELLGQENILLEFTADWCPTCKVLEHSTLQRDFLQSIQEQYDLHLIKVDLTQPNAEAEKLLQDLGSVSIPLTAIFPKGDKSLEPIVIRDIYTQKQLLEALKRIN